MTKRRKSRTRNLPRLEIPRPFLEHVGELRQRLIYSLSTVAITASLSYFFRNQLIAFLLAPLGHQQLYYDSPLGAMSFTFEICMLVGLFGASPVWLYHLWNFLKPAVPHQWHQRFWIWITISSLLALLGAIYGYAVSLPATLLVSKYFQTDNLTPLLAASEYLSFVTKYILAFALFFQIPIIVFFISLAGFVTPATLISHQRHTFLASCVIGAVFTPTPDFINQLAMAVPLFVLYEISLVAILIQERVSRKRIIKASKPIDS